MGQPPPHDRTAEFEAVALPHLNAMYNFAFSLTRKPHDAEDLVQEACLRAYRFFDSYREGTQIRAWLFRILRNTFINRYRAVRARPVEVDFEAVELAYERAIDAAFLRQHAPRTPEAILDDASVDGRVERALAGLPEDYRSVVLMALVAGMSYREIAAALEIPLGTVMSRLHRGRKLLQKELLDYAVERGIFSVSSDVDPVGED